MLASSFNTLFWKEFESIQAGSDYFHVKPITIKRWLNCATAVNPMAEKLLIIKAIGYLPNDLRWSGFRVDEQRAVLITPTGREFSPKELESFSYQKDEYKQLIELHGHIEYPRITPANENLLPFRGGRRMQPAPWVPTKHKYIIDK